jgi:hypothetical protein
MIFNNRAQFLKRIASLLRIENHEISIAAVSTGGKTSITMWETKTSMLQSVFLGKNKSRVSFFIGNSSIQPTDKGKPKGHTKIIFKVGGYKFEYERECIIYLRLRRLE